MYCIYTCTQGDRVDLCAGLTHARRIRVHRGSRFCSRGTLPVNGIFSELSRSSAYGQHTIYRGREIKCPTFLAFYRSSTVAGRACPEFLLRNVSQWYRRESDDPRVFASASRRIEILSPFSFSCSFPLPPSRFLFISSFPFFLKRVLNVDGKVVNVTRLLSMISWHTQTHFAHNRIWFIRGLRTNAMKDRKEGSLFSSAPRMATTKPLESQTFEC